MQLACSALHSTDKLQAWTLKDQRWIRVAHSHPLAMGLGLAYSRDPAKRWLNHLMLGVDGPENARILLSIDFTKCVAQ